MWRTLSSRLALRSALGLKHRSQAPATSGRIANAAVSLLEASLLVFAGFQISKYYRARREQEQEQESLIRDVAHLRLPVLVEYNLHRARLRMLQEDAGDDAFIYAAQAARHAAEAGILNDELLLALGEIFAATCARDPRLLHALASERFPDATAPDGWRVQTLDHVHRSGVLALMLRDQAQDRPLPLRWLAVAALSAQPAQKPLAEKLLADSLDVGRSEERAAVLPVLVDLNVPDIRHLQLAALHASVVAEADTTAGWLSLATCCIKLAGGLVNDVRIRDAHLPGPRHATLLILCARHLHSKALRLLPSEPDARRNSSKEVRDAFGRLYFQRALMSLTMRDKQFFPNLDAAISWYDPGDRNHASLRELRDFAILRGVQLYREEHGKEFEIEL